MTATELLEKHYNELTKEARTAIETSDQFFDDWAGEFESAQEFNEFVEREIDNGEI